MNVKPAGYDFVYFDWDRSKVTTLTNSERETVEYPTLRAMVEELPRPTVIIGESTFESYNLHERKSVFDLAVSRGHIWYSTPNRLTYRWRQRFGWLKTDTNDVQVIRIIAEWPTTLNSIRPYKTEMHDETVDGADVKAYDYLPIENLGVDAYIGQGSWTRLRKVDLPSVDEFQANELNRREAFRARQAEAMEFRRLSSEEKNDRYVTFKRAVLEAFNLTPGTTVAGTNREFKKLFPLLANGVMWAIAFAAQNSKDRSEFEALLGAHAHGAKSMMRSQFHHWGWAVNGKGPMYKGAKLTDYRREARQLGSIVHKHGIEI